jgi:hypothetical protein
VARQVTPREEEGKSKIVRENLGVKSGDLKVKSGGRRRTGGHQENNSKPTRTLP